MSGEKKPHAQSPAARPARPLRRFLLRVLGNLALIGFGGLIALGGLELAFRLAGIGSDQLQRQDPELGVAYIAGKSGLNQGACYSASPTINSHGWRSPETTREKPEGVLRVLVLGDSFMAGLQVEDDETFAAALEELLNRQLGAGSAERRVEVINLGVPSYGNDQAYLAYRAYGQKYDPDLVLLGFYAQNDVFNNAPALEGQSSAIPKPFFDLVDGELVELPYDDPTPGWVALVRRIVQPFRIYPWLRDRLYAIPLTNRLLYAVGLSTRRPSEAPDAEAPDGPLPGRWAGQLGVYRNDYDQDWAHAWDITRALLLRLRDESAEGGADFALFAVADPLVVIPPDMLAAQLPAHSAADVDLDKPARLLAEFSAENGIAYQSLIPTFRDAIGDSESAFEALYFVCDGHWTAKGHRLAAEVVADRLAPILAERATP